jgi:hypothetical protein
MAVVFTAFAFINSIENGGTALKLGLFQVEENGMEICLPARQTTETE